MVEEIKAPRTKSPGKGVQKKQRPKKITERDKGIAYIIFKDKKD